MNKKSFGWMAMAAALVGATPGESQAVPARYRTSFHGCAPLTNNHGSVYVDDGGLHVDSGSAATTGVSCSVPTGTELVEVGDDSAHAVSQINMRLHQTGFNTVITSVSAFSASSECTCGGTFEDAPAGYFSRNSPFDCGACSPEPGSAIAVKLHVGGLTGVTTLKLLSVYD